MHDVTVQILFPLPVVKRSSQIVSIVHASRYNRSRKFVSRLRQSTEWRIPKESALDHLPFCRCTLISREKGLEVAMEVSGQITPDNFPHMILPLAVGQAFRRSGERESTNAALFGFLAQLQYVPIGETVSDAQQVALSACEHRPTPFEVQTEEGLRPRAAPSLVLLRRPVE